MTKLSLDQALLTIASLVVVASFFSASNGCSRHGGVVGESDEYSYDDVEALIQAEDEASESERARNGR
ncbi:hypothetical protein [Allorhodopirellula solitaria]|uniref:Uncharacterized protein n=1 Tax=Allorhodopirellula solitaria TaxID=2527987 RepID=A0A5C5YER8_9BACT|nr:hypothetical protein [Allorhodopirellula solitaria]TWT74247.1 hypothetical protein CA85_11340 [Allorhodopirellula solitaria]